MAEELRKFFGPRVVRAIAAELKRAHPRFDAPAFERDCLRGLGPLSLTERGAHIAEAMRRHLPPDFERAADIVVRSLGPELSSTETFGMEPFRYLPHTIFVARHGLERFETSMRAQYELTKRFSCEGSIRAFLVRHPNETYARLEEWTRDPNPHVRRLVSEGTRPRLPWAERLRDFQRDPAPVIALLERLKDDASLYVRRSVANNLNDIAKDHPGVVVDLCRRWLEGASEERRWIVNHALRSLVKKGDRGALSLLGVGEPANVRVTPVALPKRVKIGSKLEATFEIESREARARELLVDFAIHFVKAGGARRPKVFKLKRVTLAPRESVSLTARVSFAQHTTRTHHAGRHAIDAIVNGTSFPLGEFDVAR